MKLKFQEEIDLNVRLQDVLAQGKKIKKSGTGYIMRCPAHDDGRPSLSVSEASDGKLLLHCHAGCSYESILQGFGLWQTIDLEPKASKIVATYDYTDVDGELLYQVVRLEPKSFRQRRPDGNGGWIYNLQGVQRTIYRLPFVVQATTPVIIAEGERDVDLLTSLGYNATTNSGGAGKWTKEYNKFFRGLEVIIIPDNDEPGLQHADEVSKHLYFTAKSVKIVPLEGLKAKEDLSDWLLTHESGDLDVLIATTEPLEYSEEDIQLDLTEPHDADAELGILGAILKDNKYIAKVVESDVATDFFIVKNKHVIQAMVDAFNANENIDRISLSARLNKSKKLGEMNVLEYLKSIEQNTPDNLNVDNWIKIVQGKSDFRKYAKIAKKLNTTVYTEGTDSTKLGDIITEDIYNVRRKDKLGSYSLLGDTAFEVLQDAKELKFGEITGLPTGFKTLDEITSGLQKTDLIVIAARPSMGKEQPLDAKILTPEGWTTMGHMKLGSKIINSEGKVSNVVGVFPQGIKDIYRISFSDGTSTECGLDHLWKVSSREDRLKKRTRILPLKDFMNDLYLGKTRKKYSIEYVPPVNLEERGLPLNPYLMGALLGDGTLRKGNIRFSNVDLDVVEKVRISLPESDELVFNDRCTYSIKRRKKNNKISDTKQILESLNLCVNSELKFIPTDYLYNSVDNRVELLRGLLDTDGCVPTSGWLEYSTVSEVLAEQVAELVRSLGGRATIQGRMGAYKLNGVVKQTKINYRVRIKFQTKDIIPFYCSRKVERFMNSKVKTLSKFISSVEYVGKKEAQCIMVDHHEHLYVTDDYILTHNTGLAINIASNVAFQGRNVAFFSLEMSKKQLVQRIISAEARVNSLSFRNGNLDEYDWVRMANVMPQLEQANLIIDDTAGLTVPQLRTKARQIAVALKSLDLIVVDYIQLMTGTNPNNRVQEVSQISRELKALAKELNVPVIALSQLSRLPESRNPPIPIMSDLRESGSIEQDADVVAFIYREHYYNKQNNDVKGLAQIIFSKQRNGPTGTVHLGYIDRFVRFMDLIEV